MTRRTTAPVTGHEPNPEPHWYDNSETLADELGGEAIALDTLIQTATRRLTANVDLLLEGDIVEGGRIHYFTDAQINDTETSIKEL